MTGRQEADSDFDLLRDPQGVIHFDAEVAHGDSKDVRCRLRPCANASSDGDEASVRGTQIVALSKRSAGRLPLRLHLCDQRLCTNDLDRSLQVVGQNLKAHLGSHPR